jgi:hypothetical protein
LQTSAFYYRNTGLLRSTRAVPLPHDSLMVDAARAMRGTHEVMATAAGIRLPDLTIAGEYEQLKLVTQGEIWSRKRWRVIRRLNPGW